MKVLVTGSRGYIGTYLTKYLSENDLEVFGTDVGYFSDCNLSVIQDEVSTIEKDIRDFITEDLVGFDAIVHLAALSNDPVGELDESITFDINYTATMNLAKIAKSQGVKKFIFISTQSIYGISKSEEVTSIATALFPDTSGRPVRLNSVILYLLSAIKVVSADPSIPLLPKIAT
jgi:nucleoside-diphosphate-sugar epimerase